MNVTELDLQQYCGLNRARFYVDPVAGIAVGVRAASFPCCEQNSARERSERWNASGDVAVLSSFK